MKNDARFLLNKKKLKNQSGINRIAEVQRGGSRPHVDARKILNIKRAKNAVPNKQIVRGTHNKFNKSAKGLFTKAFSAVSKAPDKRIKLTNDGNILVTAKSKDAQQLPKSSQRVPSFGGNTFAAGSHMQEPVHQWVPADVEMDNLEHIGINDLLDMESLPPAVVSPNIPPQNRLMLSRMLPDAIGGIQNTMIADQIASTSASQAKVFVTNLHTSVTKQDIMELFGDVGIVKTIQMTQPGAAVVEYFDLGDASKACSIYHNRLLDGHPMKCYLEGKMNPPRSSVSQRLGGRIESVSPISSSSSFVSNPRSRYNPRDVRFTVKLT